MSGYLKSVIKGGKCQAFRLSLRPRDPWHELLSAIQVTSPSAKKHIWREYLRCCYLCTACHCVHYRYRAQTQLSAEWVGRTSRWFNLGKHPSMSIQSAARDKKGARTSTRTWGTNLHGLISVHELLFREFLLLQNIPCLGNLFALHVHEKYLNDNGYRLSRCL